MKKAKKKLKVNNTYHKCLAVLQALTKLAVEEKSRVISDTSHELLVRTFEQLCPDDIVSLRKYELMLFTRFATEKKKNKFKLK